MAHAPQCTPTHTHTSNFPAACYSAPHSRANMVLIKAFTAFQSLVSSVTPVTQSNALSHHRLASVYSEGTSIWRDSAAAEQ